METQSNVFTPKYFFTKYLKLLVYLTGFIFVLFIVIQRGSYRLDYALILALIGFTVFQETRDLIKQIEFGDAGLIVYYFFWREKEAGYDSFKNINVNLSIDFNTIAIPLKDMTNGMELQRKLSHILADKKIRKINIEQEIKKKTKAGNKIFGYALVCTLVIGLIGGSFIQADFGVWALMLFIVFMLAVFTLSIFIKS